MAFQAALARLHGFFAKRHALVIHLAAQRPDRMEAVPRQTLGPCQQGLDLHPLRPIPGQCHKPPTPCNRMVVAVLGWGRQQMDGFATLVGTLPHAGQKLGAPTTPCWTMSHFALPPRHGSLLGLLPRCPPSCTRIDDALTGLGSTPQGAGPRRAVCSHTPAWTVPLVQAQVVVTRLGIAPRPAPSDAIPNGHWGFTSETQACDVVPWHGFVGFFARLVHMASVSAIFFWGLALTTVRSRNPIRWRTTAIVEGAGSGSWQYPWARQASKAAWAVSRVEASGGRNVGSCWACASARRRRAAATSGCVSAQR